MNTPEQFTCSVQFSSVHVQFTYFPPTAEHPPCVHVQFTYFSPTATKRFWTLWTSKFAFSTDLTRAALLRCNPRRTGHPAHRRLLRSDQSWQPTFLATADPLSTCRSIWRRWDGPEMFTWCSVQFMFSSPISRSC